MGDRKFPYLAYIFEILFFKKYKNDKSAAPGGWGSVAEARLGLGQDRVAQNGLSLVRPPRATGAFRWVWADGQARSI